MRARAHSVRRKDHLHVAASRFRFVTRSCSLSLAVSTPPVIRAVVALAVTDGVSIVVDDNDDGDR
jgi:hypothetical protein